jgi:hypothetical protein
MSYAAILINIEGLTDDSAKKITDTFVSVLGRVRHNDGMAFFRDLQPVCREQDCRATLVEGVRAEITEGSSDAQCGINLVSMSGDDKEFNAVLVLRHERDTYNIAQFYLFVPSETVNTMHNYYIDVTMDLEDIPEEEPVVVDDTEVSDEEKTAPNNATCNKVCCDCPIKCKWNSKPELANDLSDSPADNDNVKGFEVQIVDKLPEAGAYGILYMVPNPKDEDDESSENAFSTYIWDDKEKKFSLIEGVLEEPRSEEEYNDQSAVDAESDDK